MRNKTPPKYILKKHMPETLGWDRLRPLPSKFTTWPDMNHLPDSENGYQRKLVISDNLDTLAYDGRPTAIDLFAGAGGFSLGYIQAGWRIVAAVEMDYWSSITYNLNIPHYQTAPLHFYRMDIHNINGYDILHALGLETVNCIIGGPPCQSFTKIGKRKVGDPRDLLLWEFGRIIKEIQPETWVMENVPGLISKKFPDGKLVIDEFKKYMELKEP